MDSVDPINAAGVENASMLHWLAEQEALRAEKTQQAEAAKADQTYRGHKITAEDPRPWTMDRMNYSLMMARRYFWLGQYDTALSHYREFFNYIRLYGSNLGSLTKMWRTYMPVIYEMNWALMRQGNVKEAEKLYEQFLEQILTQIRNANSTAETVKKTIDAMQRADQLPEPFQDDKPVKIEHLETMAKVLENHNAPELAALMLDFAQVRLGMDQMRIAQWEERLRPAEAFKPHEPDPRPLPRLIVPQWLPYAPTQGPMPFDPLRDDEHRVGQTDGLPVAQPDMMPLQKDINPDEDRHRRQEQARRQRAKRPKRID